MVTNFFGMSQTTNSELFQYHVTYTPDIDNVKTKKRLLNEHKDIIGHIKAFDGMVLFTKIKLTKKVSIVTLLINQIQYFNIIR